MPKPTRVEPLTTEEAAALLRCTPRTLLNWRRQALIAPRRVGGRLLYPADEVARLLGTPLENSVQDERDDGLE